MTTELATTNGTGMMADANPLPSYEVMEHVFGTGDLSKLNSRQRVEYYTTLCRSLGLNPMSRPFEFITFQGKIVPYAKRDAADQLRKLHRVSITALDKVFEDGLYIVTATAKLPDGRTDQSTGAVTLTNLQGEARANAIMKAETKAKRRVTLSIVGLGFLDESEVSAGQPADFHVDTQTGEVTPSPPFVVQTTGNGVSEAFDATKKRILDKSKAIDPAVWGPFFKEYIGKWANRSFSELGRVEVEVDKMIAAAQLQAEAPLEEPRTDGPDDPALDPFAE